MEPLQHQTSQKAGTGDDEFQDGLVGQPTIALDEEEAHRFLEALERPDDRTVAKLANLRCRP